MEVTRHTEKATVTGRTVRMLSRAPSHSHCLTLTAASPDIPGWKDSPHHEFDAREASIVAAIRAASYKINGQKPPSRLPIPPAPSKPWTVSDRGAPAICFAGAAWAHRYQVVVRPASGAGGEQVKEVKDHTKEGEFFVDVGREVQACGGQGGVQVIVRGVSVDGVSGEESEALSL